MSAQVIALQLYTVRDFAEKDLAATLSQVKAMGYDAVELAGTYSLKALDFKKLLDEAGLIAISAHVPIDGFDDNDEGLIADYKALGCKLISIPWLPLEALPGGSGYEKTKASLIKAAEACKEQGIMLAYHNHDFEFKTLPCGNAILDVFLDEVAFVQAQLDTGWITAAGQDPVSYIKKYSGRCPSVHLKDIVKVDGKFEDRPIGQGIQDMAAVIKAAIEAGAFILVAELDEAVGMTSLEAARQSREYLKSIGY
ncbi:MAG: sugar phosphate isomerase/epimerase [Defluviitaleaceae bacterium]|nr:sugar phosphate isomerase/epimerase [Defluviitaleaceae bacterium]